jgi:hypothetical protein
LHSRNGECGIPGTVTLVYPTGMRNAEYQVQLHWYAVTSVKGEGKIVVAIVGVWIIFRAGSDERLSSYSDDSIQMHRTY